MLTEFKRTNIKPRRAVSFFWRSHPDVWWAGRRRTWKHCRHTEVVMGTGTISNVMIVLENDNEFYLTFLSSS